MAGKGSTRRKCQVSREEETLRYDLAFGKTTFEEWFTGMQKLKVVKDSKGVCSNCLDGLMIGKTTFQSAYKITCRIDSTIHHQWDTCKNFREDL